MSVEIAGLVEWTTAVFVRCNMDEELARLGAEALVRAEARGYATHGVIRVKPYAERLLAGQLAAQPRVQFSEQAGLVHCNAGRGLGPAVAFQVVDDAMARARDRAAVITIVRDIGHMAALGMAALRAAEAGYVVLIMQATPRVMAQPGAQGPAIGNNPFAFASPMPEGPPLVFDISAAKVARSHIVRAARRGERIPDDWAIDREGRPTTDAAAALDGAQVPMAGHKGLGIAMMVECLAGSLSGVRPPVPGSPEGVGAPARAGAFFLTLNPRLAAFGDGYIGHVAGWLCEFRAAQGEAGRYPGERAAAAEQAARARGLSLWPETIADLTAVGATVGVPFDLAS